jgi:maltooligosyltrehalose synthase
VRTTGKKAEHLVSFARVTDLQSAILIVPRLVGKLFGDVARCRDADLWEDTAIELPSSTAKTYQNLFTMKWISTAATLPVRDLLAEFPFALLASQPAA